MLEFTQTKLVTVTFRDECDSTSEWQKRTINAVNVGAVCRFDAVIKLAALGRVQLILPCRCTSVVTRRDFNALDIQASKSWPVLKR